jgi:hypothetical protein
MYIEIDKSIFDAKEVPFLGFLVSGFGLRMDPNQAKAIVNWPQPTNIKKFDNYWNYGTSIGDVFQDIPQLSRQLQIFLEGRTRI